MCTPDMRLIRHGVASFGFLLARPLSRLTGPEFAALIRTYSDDPRSQEVASAFELAGPDFSIMRTFEGWQYGQAAA